MHHGTQMTGSGFLEKGSKADTITCTPL